jgi:F-type H+-transporting ATPase subunit delta
VNNSLIAVRYAKALYKLVKEQGKLDGVNDEMVWVGEVLTSHSELGYFLYSPIYKVSQKKKIVSELFGAKCSDISLKFLLLVVEKGRENLLLNIIRDFGDLYRSDLGIKRVVYTSAVAPSAIFEVELKQQMEQLLKCKVELTLKVNKELIGGFELMVDSKLMDSSVATKLKQMKKRLLSI